MATKPLSIIFAGTPEFAVAPLEALIADDAFDVKLVISQPDKPIGRKQEVQPTPVKRASLTAGIEVLQPEDINTEYPEIEHDFLVVVAYGQIVKQHILDAPNIAAVNLHASLLPQWRGASPMQQTILQGDSLSGVTIQRMVAKLDAGPIISQKEYTVQPRETITTLHDTLSNMGAKLLAETLKNPLVETEQDESAMTMCHKLNRNTGNVDPATMTAEQIDRHVRALVPWPGVRCTITGEEVKVLETTLDAQEGSIVLPCAENTELHILSVQPPGKKPMSATDFQRGRL